MKNPVAVTYDTHEHEKKIYRGSLDNLVPPDRPPSPDTRPIQAQPGLTSSLYQGGPSRSGVWDGQAI